ncbi:MAG TPA: amino acid adenylation domain-containing protein [Streptosporangiaceae bacterium]
MAEIPLSFAQEQLWFIDEFHNGLPAHNVPHLVRLNGPVDAAALDRALEAVIARHEPLRTRLTAGRDGRPVQVIDQPAPAALELTDYSGTEPQTATAQLRELVTIQAMRPFRLAQAWPIRAHLIRLAADEHALLIVTHQTAFDDASLGVLLRELAALYQQEVSGEAAGLPDLPQRFADYATWQRHRLTGPLLADLEHYWRGALAGLEATRFPADRARPRLADHNGAVTSITASRDLLGELRALAEREGTTLAATVLAALFALLYRYTGQTDLVVGTMSPGRDRPEHEPLIGFLANALPIRADLSGDPSFTEVLGRVRDAVAGAQAHQDLPFARIVEALNVERDPGRFPVFQIGFSCIDPVPAVESAGVRFQAEPVELPASRYDISFAVRPGEAGLGIEATFTPALFDGATVGRLLGNLEVLLHGAVASPQSRISELPVLTDAELHRELVEWNDTAADLPVECIHTGIERQAARTPDAVAAQFGEQCLTYAELDGRASQIARRLRAEGVGPETLVGVCMQTGLERLAALLGIWKAGGGYVPLDPALPAERLAFVLADTAMPVAVADEQGAQALDRAAAPVTVIRPDAGQDEITPPDDTSPGDTGAEPSNVAYVIYTSGSTGQPKGVVVEHRQAINFLHGMTGAWNIGPGSAVLSFAAYTFDVSVMDMFMPLLAGARVVMAPPAVLHSPPRLADLIRDARITFACLPPAILTLLTGEQFPGLRTLLSAGEELTTDLLRAWLRPGLEIYNGYGPTEASIGSTFARLDPDTPLPPPIGRPKPNYRVYVLDTHLNPVPAGVTGELHVGGPGVARGYLNRPDLTRDRFIADPFAPGQRLYKTGDLVRRRPDGTIAFLGRIDNQVKIRGLRVELGEIETALTRHPAITQAIVTLTTDNAGEKQLAAYYLTHPGTQPTTPDLRQHLTTQLPAYMIPAYLTPIDTIPLTTNGKIDKTALPPPQADSAGAVVVPPATLLETILVDLYSTVLSREQASAADSFFDAGGNSLQAMHLVTQLRTTLAVDLDVAAVFLAPTPQQLAALLRDKHGFDDADLSEESIEGLEGLAGQQASSVP